MSPKPTPINDMWIWIWIAVCAITGLVLVFFS